MGNKLRLTVVREWEPDFDSEGYKGVEWPPESGVHKDLTSIEDIRAYEEYLYNNGDTDIVEALNADDPDDYQVKWEVVSEDQIMDPLEAPNAGQENPFLSDEELADRITYHPDAGAKAEADGAAVSTKAPNGAEESDEQYVERHRRVDNVSHPSLG